ncbi:MAG: efflux RND transporter permease subunit, partial [Planctomycetes bacterium]|nr:efflux RND transporter permease subunit [Planctomycetota bacterium]
MPSPPGLISWGVRNPVMANLAMVCILAAGFLATRGMVRETYPEFSLDHIAIDVVYPGASAADVETGITIRIEEAIQGIDGIREVSSNSSDGGCSVFVALRNDVGNPSKIVKEIQDRIERITTFPAGAEEPVVGERLVPSQVINVAVSGDVSERTLKSLTREVHDDLITDPDISQVSIVGVRDDEISIDVSEEALQRYGLSFADVMAAVARSSLDLPAGTLRTRNEEITLRTVGQRYTGADFERLVVISAPDGTLIRLNQIATVRDTFEESPKRGWFNGRPAALVSVYKTKTQDTSTIARKVRAYVAARQADLPDGVTMSIWADGSREVDGRIGMLLSNGLTGMFLVLIALTLFLGLRLSIWVAAGIPVSFAGALVILGLTDQSLNMISLLGLIMVTGIIVDDAIVIAEHIHTRRQQGLSSIEAAVTGAREMALPVLGSSATTIVAFIPLLFVSGVMGKFIRVLPIVVIAAVIASSFEAFFILPAHLRHAGAAGDPGDHAPGRTSWRFRLRRRLDGALQGIIERWYRPALETAVRRRWVTLAAAAACLAITAGLIGGGRVAFVLFPKGDSNLLRARVRFPEGTPAAVTEAAVHRIAQAAKGIHDTQPASAAGTGLVRQVFANIGQWSGFWTETGAHLGEVSVELPPAQTRRMSGAEILDAWRQQVGIIDDVLSLEMVPLEFGPTEKPLEIRLHGNDLEFLRRAADEFRDKLATYAGVYEIDDDLLPGKRELRVSLKPVARTLGLTVADLASQLREGFFGGEAVRILRDRAEVAVQVRYPRDQRRSLSDVSKVRIRTAAGHEIPFTEAADVTLVRGYSSIWRQDGQRRVRVRANVDERRANAEQILDDLEATFLPEAARRYRQENPEGDFSYSIGGQRAQIAESLGSLTSGLGLALVVIYALLASILRSYLQPLVIMAAIPVGVIGVVAGHLIMGYDLTIMSAFGAVALTGVVVNDALVLVVRTNRLVAGGQPIVAAVIEAGRSRFRA